MSEAETLASVADVGGPQQPLLEVRSLSKHFKLSGGLFGQGGVVRAVDDVSFAVGKGEILGIVGESGCGKSTTARLIIGLIAPDVGEIILDGEAVGAALSVRVLRRRVQMVFQDSYASLNPRLTIEDTIAFGPKVHGCSADEAHTRAHDLLCKVGLDPALFADRYPHELSGGQRQRVNIARALALAPRLVLLDEAVSALDKSVEAQVLNLLLDLKDDLGLTYVFISHDLSVMRQICTRIAVMYLGRIVELAESETIFEHPRHPYTALLISAVPRLSANGKKRERVVVGGDVPSPIDPPSGCVFHPRCPRFHAGHCDVVEPELVPAPGDSSHIAACYYPLEYAGQIERETLAP